MAFAIEKPSVEFLSSSIFAPDGIEHFNQIDPNNYIDFMYGIAKKSVMIDSSSFDPEVWGFKSLKEKANFVRKVLFEMGHEGIGEHIFVSFEVLFISRSMSHQAVRNRIASFLEGSLRYVEVGAKEGGMKYIIPYSIRNNPILRAKFHEDMEKQEALYKDWIAKGLEMGLTKDKAKELARNVLPHATSTTYMFTMNFTSLIRLLNKRLCVRAEDPFREVAEMILGILRSKFPEIFNYVDRVCKQKGYCPEGSSSCGMYPTLAELKQDYKGHKCKKSLQFQPIAV